MSSILTSDELRSIKQQNDSPKVSYGRPVKLINDLLDTIFFLKKEKKKWQRLAEDRGLLLKDINSLLIKSQNKMEMEN